MRQRADRYNVIGRPKSEAGERTVPLLPMVVNALREHRVACPKREHDLVFPNGKGNVESHTNIINHGLIPAMIAAGIVTEDRQGEIYRPAQPAALLCVVVHQPPRRRRPRTAAQGGAGAARACLDPDDRRRLRPSVPARRRWRRAARHRNRAFFK